MTSSDGKQVGRGDVGFLRRWRGGLGSTDGKVVFVGCDTGGFVFGCGWWAYVLQRMRGR